MLSLNQFGSLHQLFGGCSSFLCFNEAVHYDADGRGYCIAHTPGELLDDDDD